MSSVDLESLILVSVAAFFRIAIPFEVEDEDGEFWLKFKILARIFSSPAGQSISFSQIALMNAELMWASAGVPQNASIKTARATARGAE